MPIFVWIAIAFAIVLIGATPAIIGTGVVKAAAAVHETANSPIGYVVTAGFIAIIGIAVWNKTRNKNNNDKK
jgi:hypothetical protein